MVFIHQYRRKRVHQKLEPYPHDNIYYRALDAVVSIVAVVAPLATLPQAIDIWINHQTDGVSLLTWSLFLVNGLPLLLYSIAHKDMRLIIMYSLYAVLNSTVVVGIILFS